MSSPPNTRPPLKGRGAVSNFKQRFEQHSVAVFDDGWDTIEEELPPLQTTVTPDPARSIITRNNSPDIGFHQSINPYRGCEHGCIYCFARPTHAYLNLSPGLDFETRLFYKQNAAGLLDQELRKPGYVCEPIMLGASTDPYQPVEKELRVTRGILEVLARFRQPVGIITKGTLIERDLDLLSGMAGDGLVQVFISVTSLRNEIKRMLEPRAASPARRLELVRRLTEAGVPVGVLVAPVIPVITDGEMEAILKVSREAGASMAGYVLLRLPHEVKDLFREWLTAHEPGKATHVMSLINQARGGKDYDSRWGQRQTGTGEYADMLAQRFQSACRRYGLNRRENAGLNTSAFQPPPAEGDQLSLWR
jgi:DNA repair photolyase